jgi:hypothetical protein
MSKRKMNRGIDFLRIMIDFIAFEIDEKVCLFAAWKLVVFQNKNPILGWNISMLRGGVYL